MKIELGKFYKRRDGEIAGPVSQGSGFGDSDSADFFTTPEPNPEKRGPSNITYFENGYFYRHSKDSWDLVEEVPPPSSLPDPRDARIVELEAQLDEEKRACAALRKCDEDIIRERDQLRIELEKYKPKPAIEVRYIDVSLDAVWSHNGELGNLRLIFSDGKLTAAEVIGEKV